MGKDFALNPRRKKEGKRGPIINVEKLLKRGGRKKKCNGEFIKSGVT